MFLNHNFSLIFSSVLLITLYMLKIIKYLKILTDAEVNNFVVINFGNCFKSTRKALYSKLAEKKILEQLLNRFIKL